MAGSLKGIILDIGGDTSSLSKSLQDVDKQAKQSQDALKEIEKALKFDPSSTDLLNAKQRELQSSLKSTEDRLELLKQADKDAKRQLDNGEIGIADYAKLQTEIGFTENKLKSLQDQSSGNLDKQRTEMQRAGTAVKELDGKQAGLNERLRLAEAQYKSTGDETKYAADRSEILSEQVDTQKAKVNEAKNALAAANEVYGAGSRQVQSYEKSLEQAEKELESYEKSLKDANEALAYQTSELPKAEKELKQLDKQQESLNSQMKLAESQYKLTGDKTAYQTEKVKLLGDQVATQERKVEAANIALEEATRLYGEGDERVEQYAREVDKATIELVDMQVELKKSSEELSDQTSKLKKVEKGLEDLGSKLDSVGKGMTVGITAPLMAIAAAAGVAWAEIDDALDGIATATGATGDELDDLQGSFKNVYGSMPAEASDVAEAIGEINTQFSFVGEELERSTEKVVKFASINNTQLSPSIKGAKGVISALNLDASDFGRVLDAVTVASQDTGLSTDSLFSTLQKGAPQINAMNLEVEDAAMLLGRMEQAGLDSSRIMGGLTRAQGTAAKEGKTLNEVLSSFSEYANSGAKETDIMNEAVALFGTRNGPAMAQAAQQGVFDFDALAESVRGAGGAVETTFEATLDPIDKAQIATNNLKLAGADLFDAIQVAGTPALEGLVEVLQGVTTKMSEMSPETMDLVVKLGAVAIAAGPTISVLGKLTTGAGNLVEGIGKATSAIGEKGLAGGLGSLIGPGGKIMLAVAAIGLLVAAAAKIADEFKPGTAAVRDLIAASEEADKAFAETKDNLTANASIAGELVDELRRYEKQSKLTTEEQSRMRTVVGQLNELYPSLNAKIDSQTGLLDESTDALERRLKAMQAELEFEAEKSYQLDLLRERRGLEDELTAAKERQNEAQKEYDKRFEGTLNQWSAGIPLLGDLAEASAGWSTGLTDANQDVEELEKSIEEKNAAINRSKKALDVATGYLWDYGDASKDTGDKVEASTKQESDAEQAALDIMAGAAQQRFMLRKQIRENEADYYSKLEQARQKNLSAIEAFADKEFRLSESNAAKLKKHQEDTLKAYLSYESNMNELSKKVPADVLEEMRKLGPDGAHIIQEYVNMTDEELQPYIETWSSITQEAMDEALDSLKGHPANAAKEAMNVVNATEAALMEGVGKANKVGNHTTDAYTGAMKVMKDDSVTNARETREGLIAELKKGRSPAEIEGVHTATSYAGGLSSKKAAVEAAAAGLGSAAKNKAGVSAYSEGANVGETFRSGILSKKAVVEAAAATLGKAAPKGLKHVLQIHSPSRVMAGLADDTADGYVNQLLARVKDVELAGRDLADPIAGMNTAIADIGGTVDVGAIGRQISGGGAAAFAPTIAINNPVIRDELDIRALTGQVSQVLAQNQARFARGGF